MDYNNLLFLYNVKKSQKIIFCWLRHLVKFSNIKNPSIKIGYLSINNFLTFVSNTSPHLNVIVLVLNNNF